MTAGVQLRVQPGSPVPAYRQIADQVRTAIVERRLPAGSALPGIRVLADELGIHFNTVARAYRTLAAEGWLAVAQGRAVQVLARRNTPAAPRQGVSPFRERVRHLVAEARGQGVSSHRLAAALRSLADTLESQGGTS